MADNAWGWGRFLPCCRPWSSCLEVGGEARRCCYFHSAYGEARAQSVCCHHVLPPDMTRCSGIMLEARPCRLMMIPNAALISFAEFPSR